MVSLLNPIEQPVEQSTETPVNYLKRLDVLRGIAALAVFLLYQFEATFSAYGFPWNGLFPDFLAVEPEFLVFSPMTFGWVGVPVFFVLSGFLIHWTTLKSGKFNLSHFYWKRFWRIYPPYLLAVIVFATKSGQITTDVGNVLSHIFLVHNFSSESNVFYGISPAFWTIAIEMQFYLLYPILLIFHRKIGIRKILLISLLFSLTARLILAIASGWNNEPSFDLNHLWRSTLVLWFDWILGAYLAEQFYQGKRVFSVSNVQIGLLIGGFILSVFFKPLSTALPFPLASLISAIFIERIVWSSQPLSRLELRLLPLGLCSYSFYLWNGILISSILNILHEQLYFPQIPWVTMTIGTLITFSIIFPISWFLYKVVEEKSRQLGGHLWKKFA